MIILGMLGFGNTTNTILLFLARFIEMGVWLAFVYGSLAAVYSIFGIYREGSQLEDVELDGKAIKNPDEIEDTYRIPLLEFEARPKHLELRKAAIDKCMRKWRESTDKDKLPILPSLKDLHELALYRETHRNSSTALITSISVLLIAGICGTMLNVHAALEKNPKVVALEKKTDNVLGRLANALEPARRAVSFTIILLFLKGVYSAWVTRYIADLDAYTIKKLMPEKHREIHQRVVDCYTETAEGMLKFRDSGIRRFCSNATDELAETEKHIDTSCRKHQRDTETWSKFSFPLHEMAWQNHDERMHLPSVDASPPEQVQAWRELNKSVSEIAQVVEDSPS